MVFEKYEYPKKTVRFVDNNGKISKLIGSNEIYKHIKKK